MAVRPASCPACLPCSGRPLAAILSPRTFRPLDAQVAIAIRGTRRPCAPSLTVGAGGRKGARTDPLAVTGGTWSSRQRGRAGPRSSRDHPSSLLRNRTRGGDGDAVLDLSGRCCGLDQPSLALQSPLCRPGAKAPVRTGKAPPVRTAPGRCAPAPLPFIRDFRTLLAGPIDRTPRGRNRRRRLTSEGS